MFKGKGQYRLDEKRDLLKDTWKITSWYHVIIPFYPTVKAMYEQVQGEREIHRKVTVNFSLGMIVLIFF